MAITTQPIVDCVIPYNLAYKTPLCGPCESLISSRGGLMSKGDLYLYVMRYRKVRLLSNNSHIKLDKRNENIM
jgi:hypothetical protein